MRGMAALPPQADVRFARSKSPLSAMCGRLRVGKGFFERYRTAGRSCHVFDLLMRHGSWPLAIMLSADRVPVKSTRFKWRSGTCGLSRSEGRLAWVRYAIIALSNLGAREAVPRVLVLLPYADAGSGVRSLSLRAIMAQAIRAILLARAIAAILIDRRSMSLTSQGWRV